jgi:hypothetical protein
MTQSVTIIEDPFDQASWVRLEGEDIRDLLTGHFQTWPETARLYYGAIAKDRDITPMDAADWATLPLLPGPFFVVVKAAGFDPVTLALVEVAVSVLLSVASFLLVPSVPKTGGNIDSSSNALSDRQNKARPLQRIPDIFGEVRSTPDLLGVPIKVFEDKKEVEYSLMCIGRGAYEVTDVRDDTTLVSELDGASVEVYGPYTSPLSGDDPEILIGDAITETLVSAKASNAINGQVLYAPNYKSADMVALNSGARFEYVGKITAEAINWERYFEAGDKITITGADDTKDGHTVNLDGIYEVDHIGNDGTELFLVSPASVNSDWNTLDFMGSDRTNYIKPLIEVDMVRYAGPFTMDVSDLTQVWANVVAQGGLYTIGSGGAQRRIDVTVRMTLTPLDAAGDPTGSAETFDFTIPGAATSRSLIGLTCRADPTFTGKCSVKMERTSDSVTTDGVQVSDEIKWRDLYAISPVGVTDFGNVTTIYSRSVATPAALGLKARKLNMNVIRKVPSRDGDGFTETLSASRSVDDIFCFTALDPYIGGRSLAELDVAGIYAEVAEVVSYFGTEEAAQFGYTFDDDNISFEETAAAIAEAAFCQAQRQGSVLRLSFEKATDDSTILYNHRNKLPGSETRTVSFGPLNDNDGVEYSYVDKANYDAPVVYRVPVDGSALKPKKIDSIGQRNFNQVYWHAWREYNKIIHQHVATQFTATSEAALTGRLDRILVADNTRPRAGTQDGEIVSQNGLILTLSQKVNFAPDKSYTIFLQIPDASVEAIGISAGATAYQVVLASAPSSALALGDDLYARATYWIVANDDGREQAFLVSENTPGDNGTFDLIAVNYDARYYEKDSASPA